MIELDSVSYPARKPFISRLNFRTTDGGITGIIGPCGSGKSSLLRILCADTYIGKSSSGSITINGKARELFKDKELARLISYQTGTAPENTEQTVKDFVLLSRIPHKVFMKPFLESDLQAADASIKKLGLASLKDRKLSDLSGCQLQMSLLAFAFAREAEVLLLDEPTNNLDLRSKSILHREMIRYVMNGRRSIVAASSDINFLAQVSDRIIVMHNGKIAEHGKPEMLESGLFKKYFSSEVFISRNIYNGRPAINLFHDS